MNLLKSIFVSAFITAGLLGTVYSLYQLATGGLLSPWLGTVLACGAPTLLFARLFAVSTPRTSENLYLVLAGGVIGTVLAFALGGGTPALIALAVGVIANLAYVFWYSRFPPAATSLREGQPLPELTLTENGQPLTTAELTRTPALWIFYRGNWCPLCMAQVREIAAQYRELEQRGVAVHLVSPQPEANTASLARKFDAPMRFLTDTENRAADTPRILEKNRLPAGLQARGYDPDVPRPTVFITAAGGTVIHVDLSENYRVRPEPAQYFDVLDRHVTT